MVDGGEDSNLAQHDLSVFLFPPLGSIKGFQIQACRVSGHGRQKALSSELHHQSSGLGGRDCPVLERLRWKLPVRLMDAPHPRGCLMLLYLGAQSPGCRFRAEVPCFLCPPASRGGALSTVCACCIHSCVNEPMPPVSTGLPAPRCGACWHGLKYSKKLECFGVKLQKKFVALR